MPNFKRFLSGIMALVITLSMFSCLSVVVANADYYGTSGTQTVYGAMDGDSNTLQNNKGVAVTTWRGKRNGPDDWTKTMTKEEFEAFNNAYQNYNNGFGIKSYDALVNEYGDNKFVYFAAEIYETGKDGNLELTDHKVKYGQILTVKVYIKSNVWLVSNTLDMVFTRKFFDINVEKSGVNPYCDSGKSALLGDTLNNAGYVASYTEGVANSEHAYAAAASEQKCTLTANPVSSQNAFKACTGYSTEFLFNYDYIRLMCSRPATYSTGTAATEDTYAAQYTIGVRTTAEDSNRQKNADATETVRVINVGDIGEFGTDFHYGFDYHTSITSTTTYVTLSEDASSTASKKAFQADVITDTRDLNHTFRLYGTEYTFVNDDGSTITTQEYEPDAAFTAPTEIPTSSKGSSFTFVGWDYDGDGVYDASKDVAPSVAGSEDKTVKAIYEESSTPVTTYNITYKFNDGTATSEIKSESLEEGAGIALPTVATTIPTGKQVVWTYAKEDGTSIDAITTMPAYNVVATASLEWINYTLTFKQDGQADVVQTYHYGDTIKDIPAITQETGSTKAWTYTPALDNGTSMPNSNVVATVTATANQRTVKFVCLQDAAQTQTNTWAYGKEYTLPTFTGIDSGLTLISWTSSDGQTVSAADVSAKTFTVPDYDVTWTANYQGKAVTVTFNIKLGNTTLWTVTKDAHYGDQMDQYIPTQADYKDNLAIDGVAKDAAGYTTPTWNADKTVRDSDKSYDATVTANSFNLTIKTSTGVTLYNDSVAYDADITAIKSNANAQAEEIAGYTVAGTSAVVPDNMPAKNTSYEIILSQLDYTVTLCRNEGSFPEGTETDKNGNYVIKELHYGDKFTAVIPTREGYDFKGWATSQDAADKGTVEYTDLSSVQVTKSLQYYAVWEASTYKITYQTNTTTGTTYENYAAGNYTYTDYAAYGTKTESIAYGKAVTVTVAKPVVEGYEYSDWALYYEDGSKFEGTTMPAANLIAKSTGKQLYYTDTYTDNEGNVIEAYTSHYVYGAKINHPALPVVSGMTDPYWYPVQDNQPAKDVKFEYRSSAGVVGYKVEIYTQNIKDNEYTLANTYDHTGTTGSTANLNNSEKAMAGFTLNADKTIDGQKVLGDGTTVLKAYFDRNSHTITVTGDADSAKNKAYTYKYGEDITEWVATEKEGSTATVTYSRDGSTMTFPSSKTMPDFDFVVTVDYGENAYTVTYIVDGEPYGVVDTVVYGKDVALRTYGGKIGYDFSGWTSEDVALAEGATSFTMPAKNVTISGTNTVQQHKFTFVADGNTVDTLTGNYGEAVDFSTAKIPSKVGYTFVKWDVTYTTFQAEDKVINAIFSRDKHDANFLKEDNSTYKVVSTYYDDFVEAPDGPSKVGYTFNGWIMNDDATHVYTAEQVKAQIKMGIEDITFKPTYTANSYTAKFYASAGDTATFAVQENIVFGSGEVTIPEGQPERAGFIFKGWKLSTDSTDTIISFPYKMTTEGVAFVAVWAQDTQNCQIESIVLSDPTIKYTGREQRDYTITLKPGVEAYSIIVYRGGDSWYEFNKASFAKYGDKSLVKSITTNTNNQQVWEVKMILPEATDTYYAYIVYMNGEAGGKETYYNFDIKYDAKDEAEKKAEYMGATISENAVVRGESLVWTVKTSKDVSWLKFDYAYTLKDGTSKEYQVYYKKDNAGSNFTYTENEDNTATWAITMPFTYSGNDSSVKQTYSVSYRVGTASTYYEGDKDIIVTVGYTKDALIETPAEYDKFSVISVVTADPTVTEGKSSKVVVKTTADCSKVRLGYTNPSTGKMKYGTYQTTSKNVTYEDNNGVRTWTINMKFVKGVTEYQFDARGSEWSTPVKFVPAFG